MTKRLRTVEKFARVASALALAALLLPVAATAQIPEEFTNLQVLPEDIEQRRLIGIMRSFSMGLGVRCEHCHVGDPAQGFSSFDFASDDKLSKQTAREMLKMTRTINETHIGGLESGAKIGVRVRCVSCHRGQNRPVMLQDALAEEMANQDVESAVAKYRELRAEHYGSHTFDFSEGVLLEMATNLGREEKYDEAEALLSLNLEFYPDSAFSHHGMGEVQMRQERTEDAIRSFERSLEIMPQNPRAQQYLEKLKADSDEDSDSDSDSEEDSDSDSDEDSDSDSDEGSEEP